MIERDQQRFVEEGIEMQGLQSNQIHQDFLAGVYAILVSFRDPGTTADAYETISLEKGMGV